MEIEVEKIGEDALIKLSGRLDMNTSPDLREAALALLFAFGKPLPKDPTRPITSFKTAWSKVRKKAGVKGQWHDNRHTLVTELAESGAGDEVIMSIAGHVSRAMLSRYSHGCHRVAHPNHAIHHRRDDSGGGGVTASVSPAGAAEENSVLTSKAWPPVKRNGARWSRQAKLPVGAPRAGGKDYHSGARTESIPGLLTARPTDWGEVSVHVVVGVDRHPAMVIAAHP